MSDKEIFTREETSNLIQQARKQGALEELEKINTLFGNKCMYTDEDFPLMDYLTKRLKELKVLGGKQNEN